MRRAIATLAAAAGLSLLPAAAAPRCSTTRPPTRPRRWPTARSPTSRLSNYFGDPDFDRTADDFVVPFGEIWTIDEIDVTGALSSSPVDSQVNAYIYSDGSGTPGGAIFTQLGIAATNSPNYHVPLTGGPALGPGTYWVTVQKVVGCGPFWSWGTETVGQGTAAKWFTTSGGPGCAALVWHRRQTCFPGPGHPDQTFLLGTRRTPTGSRPRSPSARRTRRPSTGPSTGSWATRRVRPSSACSGARGSARSWRRTRPCTSPKRYKNLDPGRYRFKVRGIDAGGRYDFTPARDSFKVLE